MSLLEIANIHKSFDQKNILNGINLKIEEGDKIFLMGPSGVGKSTFLDVIVGFLKPDAGNVYFCKNDIFLKKTNKIQLVMQDSYLSINPALKVKDVLEEPLLNINFKGDYELKCLEMLKDFNLPTFILEKRVRSLSGGERQKLALCRIFAVNPKIIAFDESFSALDKLNRSKIMDFILQKQRELALGYLFTSHDLSFAKKYESIRYYMQNGVLTHS